MKFGLTAEQEMLRNSVRRFIEKEYKFDARTQLLKQSPGGSAENWRIFADYGWLGAALPGDFGGLDGSLVETAIIAQELGRGLVVEPFVGAALVAQTVLASGAAARKDILPPLAAGSRRFAVAYAEPGAQGMPLPVATSAAPLPSGGYRLTGRKSLVLGAHMADAFVVSTNITGAEGVSLVLVAADARGVVRQDLPMYDGGVAQEISLRGVEVSEASVLGDKGQGLAALETGLAHATIALCADLVGAMERSLEMTADYLRTRQQFGVTISSFQALQHRMADLAAELEVARSMLYVGLAAMHDTTPEERTRTLSQVKALIGRAARTVCGQAIQLHGGIGMTDEFAIGHYFKRAVVGDLLLGSGVAHEAACATASSSLR